jgi:hypothetical protein
MVEAQDKTGQRFGRLIVVKRVENVGDKVQWLCKCTCGNKKIVRAYALTLGLTRSCGCLQTKAAVKNNKRRKKHGKCGTLTYHSWQSMKQRCLNKNHDAYPRYGGRGIKIHMAWIESFEQFHADLGTRPGRSYSLDRIDPNGDYIPGNVRWATHKQQQNNRR